MKNVQIIESIKPFKPIVSLGNGCDATIFTWKLGIKKDSPLDNSFFINGPRGLEYIFNGEFRQRILDGDIIPSAEGEEVNVPLKILPV